MMQTRKGGFAANDGALLFTVLAGFTAGSFVWAPVQSVVLEPLALIAGALTRIGYSALLLLIIDRCGGFADFGLRGPAFRDVLGAVFAFFALAAVSASFSLISSLLGTPNAPLQAVRSLSAGKAFITVAAALLSLSTGYFEELLFRVFAFRVSERANIAFPLALLVSCVWFASLHAYEGLAGVILAFLFGLVLSLIWKTTRNLHVLAIAHALHNFAVYCVLIFRPGA